MDIWKLRRNLAPTLVEAMRTFRAVVLGGARQCGKTTLVSAVPQLDLVSLDDPALLDAARDDPAGFVSSLPSGAAIDEFQRAGEPLLLAVKYRLDRSNERGQLLLTGSANYLAGRSIAETLAGRTARMVLWPLSLGERLGVTETFIDRLFDPAAWPPPAATTYSRDELAGLALQGGYPEQVVQSLSARARGRWFDSYIADVVSREALHGVGAVRSDTDLRTVLRLLAARAPGELVVADVARDAGLHRDTVAAYVALLQALYLIVLVPAWSTHATNRAKRHPKVLLCDSGLLAHLRGVDEGAFGLAGNPKDAGAVFESFVLAELHKQATWAEKLVDLAHFRDRNGAEVDCIVTDRITGRIAGIEIKLTATPRASDARHLAALRDRLGEQFSVGLVIHAGQQTVPLGERIWAVPVGSLTRAD